MLHHRSRIMTCRFYVLFTIMSGWLLTACSPSGALTTVGQTIPTPPSATALPRVARYDRYLLVNLTPPGSQYRLLSQVMDITFPPRAIQSVGDALRYLLKESGYRLCGASAPLDALLAYPLPAAHRHLGPVSLDAALTILAGPAWQLTVDEQRRLVCFIPVAEVHHGA